MTEIPTRIVCLTEETTETLYLLGAGDRVVGVSGYTVRPPEARQKPRVSAFITARFDKIEALEPDLILAFSDLQADHRRRARPPRHTVVTFNQRTVAEILQMIRMLGGLVGCPTAPKRSPTSSRPGLASIRASASRFPSAATRLLRGVGRPADFRHPLGRGAGRDRRRRSDLSRTCDARARQGSHRRSGRGARRDRTSSLRRGAARR